jgi:hypothetical protein
VGHRDAAELSLKNRDPRRTRIDHDKRGDSAAETFANIAMWQTRTWLGELRPNMRRPSTRTVRVARLFGDLLADMESDVTIDPIKHASARTGGTLVLDLHHRQRLKYFGRAIDALESTRGTIGSSVNAGPLFIRLRLLLSGLP